MFIIITNPRTWGVDHIGPFDEEIDAEEHLLDVLGGAGKVVELVSPALAQ
jgi:hypothetical protein